MTRTKRQRTFCDCCGQRLIPERGRILQRIAIREHIIAQHRAERQAAQAFSEALAEALTHVEPIYFDVNGKPN